MAPAIGDPADLASTMIRATGPVWFPGLARALVRRKWDELERGLGLDFDSYGTTRILAGSRRAARGTAAEIELPRAFGRSSPVVIEVLGGTEARGYEELGLHLAEPAFAGSTRVGERLTSALDTLGADPTLAGTIGALLGVIHVVVAESPDYDVSYSDPKLPFSVFVGMHPQPGAHAALRLAEGLLHECMHLQLTLIEEVLPLVSGGEALHFSPWQMTMRPAQGVLHGTYVFSVIRDALATMLDRGLVSPDDLDYVADRIAVCRDEVVRASADLLLADGLTVAGRTLVSRLVAKLDEGASS